MINIHHCYITMFLIHCMPVNSDWITAIVNFILFDDRYGGISKNILELHSGAYLCYMEKV